MSTGANEPTYGMKLVRLNFNPSANPAVTIMKEAYASIIDKLDIRRSRDEQGRIQSSEFNRGLSIAITEAQGACMWAVNAITFEG